MALLRITAADMTAPQLTPEQARELNSRCATLLLLDVPPRTQLGFDYHTFTTADKFRGIKMIPPGPHIIHITPPPSSSPHTSFASPAPPSHHWLYLHTAEVVVRRFTPPATLQPLTDNDEEQRYKLGVARFDFDSGLGPYQPRGEWSQLSGWLSEAVVVRLEDERQRMEGVWDSRWRLEDKFEPRIEEVKEDETKDDRQPTVSPVHSEQSSRETDEQRDALQQTSQQAKAAANTARRQQLLQLTEEYSAIYTPISPLVIPSTASPAAITQLHLDRSHTVQQLLAHLATRYRQPATAAFNLLLAELQHSFLSFLVAHDPSAFSYYKHALTVLSLSAAFFSAWPALLSSLLGTLRPQLSELPADWLNDPLSSDSFVLECVERLLDIADECGTAAGVGAGAMEEVREASERVEAMLQKKFGWERRREADDVSADDDDEYAPVVVQLPSEHDDASDASMLK